MSKHFQLTIYIAGPMTGLPEFNYPAFFKAAEELKAEGHAVLNPAKNNGKEWTDYMRESLRQISTVDGMFMLKGWEKSKGARIEHQLAKDLGLRIRYQEPGIVQQAQQQREKDAIKLSSADCELKSMQAAGASTADLGKQLLSGLVMVDAGDVRAVLEKLRHPSIQLSDNLSYSCHRLSEAIRR